MIILQAEKEVIASQHSSPISTLDLNEYIAVKLTSTLYSNSIGAPSIYSSKFKGPLSITNTVSVWVAGKELYGGAENPLNRAGKDHQVRLLDKIELSEEFDLVDGAQHNIRVEYDKEIMKIYVDQFEEPVLATALSISDLLTCDNGS